MTFGGRYDASPVIAKDGSVPPPDEPSSYQPTASPGGRPPHAWLDDGRSLFDSFHAGWTLLVLGESAPAWDAFLQAAAELRIDLRAVAHASAPLAALYEAPLVLIRPDQIVAWRGGDAQDARGVLRQVTGQPDGSPAGRAS